MPLQNPPIKADRTGYATHFEGGIGIDNADYDGSTGHKAIGKTPGHAFLTKGSAGTDYTLAAPIDGGREVGGDDGLELLITAQTAYAHVVTTPANKLNTNKTTLTWTAAIGNSAQLVARGGVWYATGLNGVAVS